MSRKEGAIEEDLGGKIMGRTLEFFKTRRMECRIAFIISRRPASLQPQRQIRG